MDFATVSNWQTYLSFAAYLLFMVCVGAYFCKKSSSSISSYLLGDRGLGGWVTAFSAEASDMSGWLLMGLPGAVYCFGPQKAWIAIGLFIGTTINWLMVAKRLRVYTEKTNALTMIGFLDERVKCPGNLIRFVGGIITLFFFLVYSASGLVGAGKLFESMFQIPYTTAVLIGAGVMLLYILLGGFLAVCWTDFFQGILMFIAIVAIPIYAFMQLKSGAISEAYQANNISASLFPEFKGLAPGLSQPLALTAILSTAAWGLGYFGQPHILVRFMGIKSHKEVNKATIIATIWVFFSLTCAILVGVVGRGFPDIQFADAKQAETVFIMLIGKLFHPLLAGVFLAAILAAIMSTIDSQLLVCSSTITSDIYARIFKGHNSDVEQLWVSRVSVFAITLVAGALALDPPGTIMDLVEFAWGGFGAAFGPAILMCLFSRKVNWHGILCGMVVATIVSLVWKLCWHFDWMYEILPGFLANLLIIVLFNWLDPQKDKAILDAFDEVDKVIVEGK